MTQKEFDAALLVGVDAVLLRNIQRIGNAAGPLGSDDRRDLQNLCALVVSNAQELGTDPQNLCIEVNGGCVQSVAIARPDIPVTVTVLDWDSLETGGTWQDCAQGADEDFRDFELRTIATRTERYPHVIY